MTRDEARERLWELVFGEPSPEEVQALNAAVREDPELARELESLRDIARVGRSLPAAPLPREVRERILRAARQQARTREGRASWLERLGWSPVAMAAAATVTLVVVGAHLWQRQQEALSSRGAEGLPGVASRAAEMLPAREEAAAQEEGAGSEQEAKSLVATTPRAEPTASSRQAPGSLADAAATGRKGETAGQGDGAAARGGGGKVVATLERRTREPAPTSATRDEVGAEAPSDAVPFGDNGKMLTGRGGTAAVVAGGDREQAEGLGGLGRGAPARKAARAPLPAAAAPAGAVPTAAEEREGTDSRCPAQVRELRRRGQNRQALAVARGCLEADLSGEDLLETLELAARLATELGQKEEAEHYLRRLQALPGGEERSRLIAPP